MDPLRGEVWEAHLPRGIGSHRVVVLAISTLIPRLSAVTVAIITGTEGPPSTHVPVDSDAGLTGHDISYINATDLHTLDKPRLHKRRGLLSPGEMARLEEAVRLYLGL
jgi:mRNA interferase MazF